MKRRGFLKAMGATLVSVGLVGRSETVKAEVEQASKDFDNTGNYWTWNPDLMIEEEAVNHNLWDSGDPSVKTYGSEDLGNGWHRVWFTSDTKKVKADPKARIVWSEQLEQIGSDPGTYHWSAYIKEGEEG
jgi:hypothetical protein